MSRNLQTENRSSYKEQRKPFENMPENRMEQIFPKKQNTKREAKATNKIY